MAAAQLDRAPVPGSYVELGQDFDRLLDELCIENVEQRQELDSIGTDEHPVKLHDEYNAVFLGQIAYILDKAAQNYTGFQIDEPALAPTVGFIRMYAARGLLTTQEEDRWAEFEQYLAAKGWDLQELIDLLRTLRRGSRLLPDYYAEDLEKVKVEQLRCWARNVYKEDETQLQKVLALIELANEFGDTKKDRPLAILGEWSMRTIKRRVKKVVAAGLGQTASKATGPTQTTR